MHCLSCISITGEQMTLDTPNGEAPRVVFTNHLGVGVKAMTVHFDMEPMPSALRADSHNAAFNVGPDGKNCVIRDHAVSSLNRQPLQDHNGDAFLIL